MKFKALRNKNTKELIEIQNFGGVNTLFTSNLPLPLPMSATMELIKTYYETQSSLPEDINLDDYELAEFDFFEADTVGADIRNKLTPLRSVLSLIRIYDKEKDERTKHLIKDIIVKEIRNCQKCIRYISKLL